MPTYQQLFELFLKSNPFFRRKLIKIKDIHKWIKDLKINKHLERETNLKIFLEYLHHENVIIPFFKIEFPFEHKFHIRWNNMSNLTNDIRENSWEEVYKENLIIFLDNEQERLKKWNHKNTKREVEENLYSIEESIHYYHPIQFIQLLSILFQIKKINPDLLSIKTYFEYYWERFFEFEGDSYVKRIKEFLNKQNKSIQEYIHNIRKKQYFTIYEQILPRFLWLKSEVFQLWIKLEAIFSPSFYIPSHLKAPFQIKRNIIRKNDVDDAYRKDIYDRREKFENIQEFFSSEEVKIIIYLLDVFEEEHDFEGLDKWFDLIIQINKSKKNKLKGFLSFYVNIFEIIRILKLALWYLEPDEEKKKRIKPEYYFRDVKDKEIYMQHLLGDYNLFAEKIYIIYVEGITEESILNKFFSTYYRLYRSINIDIHNMTGESNKDFTFGYAIRHFKSKKHFLFLDADTEKDERKRRKDLKDKKINEKYYKFFKPDFVTENFTSEQIYESYQKYMKEEEVVLTEETSDLIKDGLVDCKTNNKSYEKFLENLHEKSSEEVDFLEFSKTGLAKFLAEIVIKEKPSEKNFSFQHALEPFFKDINKGMRKYIKRKGYNIIS